MPKPIKKAESERPVLYPEPVCKLYLKGSADGPMTAERMKQLLGWETEAEYKTRLMAEQPGLKEEKIRFDDYLLTDTDGEKVQCWNNVGNRPFREAHAGELAQEMLMTRWRFNGECIIVGKTGIVESGQHRGVALVLAEQKRAKDPEKYQAWEGPVEIETAVMYGVAEDEATVMTLDNVLARSEADVFFTSDLLKKGKNADGKTVHYSNRQRNELTRMLATCVDMLWKRLGASKGESGIRYQTHAESSAFLARHKRIEEAVQFAYNVNTPDAGRGISLLKISAGQAAAALYLMAASDSEADGYRSADPPNEKALDLSRWEKATDFWALLIGTAKELGPVRAALAALVDPDNPGSGRSIEKFIVIAKAWEAYVKGGGKISQKEVAPAYDEAGGLAEWPGFGGADYGPPKPKSEKAKPAAATVPVRAPAKKPAAK